MNPTAFPPLSPSEPPRVFGAPSLHTDGDLLALAVTSDRTLWAVEEPGELRGWDLTSRQLIQCYPLDQVAELWVFNWAGRLLASTSDEVSVWEVASGNLLACWSTPCWITAVAFQPGTTVLATGHDDGRVCLWDWSEQRLIRELFFRKTPISAVCFCADGKRLASAGEDRKIHLWDIHTGKHLGTLEGHTDRIPALAWHPKGDRIFSAGWDTTVRVWDTNTFEPIILLNSHTRQVHALALSGDGKLLACSDADNAVHIWDVDAYKTQIVLREAASEVRWLAFAQDEASSLAPDTLAYGSADRIIHLWDSRQGAGGVGMVDPLVCRTAVALSPQGDRLYSLGAGTELRGWDVSSGRSILKLEESHILREFAISPDGRWIAASRAEQDEEDRTTLALYDAATGQRVALCDGQRAPITALAFDSTSSVLVSGGLRSSDVWLWSVPSGQPLLLIPDAVAPCSVEVIACQPGGSLVAIAGIDWLATSGQDGEVAFWDLQKSQMVRRLTGGATALAWHPSGRRLAIATLRHVIRFFDLDKDGIVLELTGHHDTITSLAFSADGLLLASGGDDRILSLWDLSDGTLTGALELDSPIKALAFAPDGQSLFTGNGNTSCYQIEVEQLLSEQI